MFKVSQSALTKLNRNPAAAISPLFATQEVRHYSDMLRASKRNTGGCYNYGFAVVVGQEYAVMLHRFERFANQLEPGFNWKLPFIDKVEFVHDLRE